MRILFICQFFAPDITAAAFRMSDFARLLAQSGDEVRVITSYPHKAHVTDVDDRPYEEAGIRVYRCQLRKVKGPARRHICGTTVRLSAAASVWEWKSGAPAGDPT